MRKPIDFTAYNVEVEDPRHIPDLVQATQKLGEYDPVLIGLDHQEGKHAMRGRYEDFGNLEPGVDVFRRPDGGNTVYTDKSKYALNFGLPITDGEQKRADSYSSKLHDFVDERIDTNLQKGQRDLYFNDDQVLGLSQRFGEDSVVVRGYWAEDIPDVYGIMHQDGFSTGEIDEHQQAMKRSADILGEKGFYQEVMDEFQADTITSSEFLEGNMENPGEYAESLLEKEGARRHQACFLERPE